MTHREIQIGIRSELAKSAEFVEFIVESRLQQGAFWQLTVDSPRHGLDETMEGSAVWWAGPPKGAADVLSVIPEEQQLNLRFATTPPPAVGERLRIYPPRYLSGLETVWDNPRWARICFEWLDRVTTNNEFDPSCVPSATGCPTSLRQRQIDAFTLPGWDMSFLWGPPGTGKTFTLGRLLAQYLLQFPRARVLLLSTTNSAVDQALAAVDDGLTAYGRANPAGIEARKQCKRVGNHFQASYYTDRSHLLPVVDLTPVKLLSQLQSQKPGPANLAQLNQWKTLVDRAQQAIRAQAKDVVKQSRLIAMTTTRAVFTFEELHENDPFDLIVIDEASQVGIAHALALAPLGKKVLFAGDPKQLSPIVQSTHDDTKKWLGRSMFSYKRDGTRWTCLLNEQSRMAAPICQIISNVFYDGVLVVAKDAHADPRWHNDRSLTAVSPMGAAHTHVELLEQDGQWSSNYDGPIRQPGAMFVVEIVDRLTSRGHSEHDIVELTPFRAQRALIRQKLRSTGFRHVGVTTVHRSQGTERHTVIFDPTLGNSKFLLMDEGRRLINVALSRAKARLIVMVSASDRSNPLLDQIANIIQPPIVASKNPMPVCQAIQTPGFPTSLIDCDIRIENAIVRVLKISPTQLHVYDYASGRKVAYDLATLFSNCGLMRVQPSPTHTPADELTDRIVSLLADPNRKWAVSGYLNAGFKLEHARKMIVVQAHPALENLAFIAERLNHPAPATLFTDGKPRSVTVGEIYASRLGLLNRCPKSMKCAYQELLSRLRDVARG